MTPTEILQLPNTVQYVTIFLDLPGVFNLLLINKTIYRIIINDPRFVFIKILYLTYTEDRVYITDWINLIKTNRYNYYKIISKTFNLFGDYVVLLDEGKAYYERLHHDYLIETPKCFNKLYNAVYYDYKLDFEVFQNINWYHIRLNKLIQYYLNNDNTSIFHKKVINLPIAELLDCRGTKLADNLIILLTNNNHIWNVPDFKFKYFNTNNQYITGSVIYYYEPFNDSCINIYINEIATRFYIADYDLHKNLAQYLMAESQLIATEAELFAAVIIAHYKK